MLIRKSPATSKTQPREAKHGIYPPERLAGEKAQTPHRTAADGYDPASRQIPRQRMRGGGGIRGFAVLWRGRGQENRYSARSLHWSVLAAGQKIPALRFPRSILMVADRTSDNKKVSFDRAILFELFMILMQLRSMPKTKEFILYQR